MTARTEDQSTPLTKLEIAVMAGLVLQNSVEQIARENGLQGRETQEHIDIARMLVKRLLHDVEFRGGEDPYAKTLSQRGTEQRGRSCRYSLALGAADQRENDGDAEEWTP